MRCSGSSGDEMIPRQFGDHAIACTPKEDEVTCLVYVKRRSPVRLLQIDGVSPVIRQMADFV